MTGLVPTARSSGYSTDLLAHLSVQGRLVELEPAQGGLLDRVLAGPAVSVPDLKQAGVLAPPASARRPAGSKQATVGENDLLTVLQVVGADGENEQG